MPIFNHPVCDLPVRMPNGEAWMIQDGFIVVDVDVWATDGPVPYTVEAGGVEAYHARLDLIDAYDREVTLELDAGHPVVKHLLTARREAIIEEAIDHRHE